MPNRFSPIPYLVNADVPWRIAQFQQEVEDNLQPRPTATLESPTATRLAWEETSNDYVTDEVLDTVGAPTSETSSKSIRVAVLTPDGTIPGELIPWGDVDQVDNLSDYFLAKDEPINRLRVGSRVELNYIYGNGGDRVQLIGSNEAGSPAPMPYFEVAAAREGTGTDGGGAIGGYQAHWVGDGTTPPTQDRLYWFLELKELGHTRLGREELAGYVGIGVSSRNNVKLRAMIFHAGGRDGLIFHGQRPYVEIARNTALTLDDRTYPEATPGTLQRGEYINLRREGTLGIKKATYSDAANGHGYHVTTRNRGTVAAPAYPSAGDTVGAERYGTTSNVNPDYLHIDNTAHIAAEARVTATEEWEPATALGSRYTIHTTAPGTVDLRDSFAVEEPAAAGETSILVRVNRDGTTTQTRVEVGPADSAGTGYRALRIPN